MCLELFWHVKQNKDVLVALNKLREKNYMSLRFGDLGGVGGAVHLAPMPSSLI
jgi:hypothetical protein